MAVTKYDISKIYKNIDNNTKKVEKFFEYNKLVLPIGKHELSLYLTNDFKIGISINGGCEYGYFNSELEPEYIKDIKSWIKKIEDAI